MSKETNLDSHNYHKKEGSEDIDILGQSSDQNLKRTVERQVTIYDVEEAKTIQETPFTSNDEVVELSRDKVKENHSFIESDDHKINTVNSSHHTAEENDVNIEYRQDKNKQKCQCLFEVFECTIWALRNMGRSTYYFVRRNCCFCWGRKVDLGNRKINDDDIDYWDGNLVENDDGDYCTYNQNNDDAHERKATFHLNEAFDEATTKALKDHCISKSSDGDTEKRHSEKKEKNGIDVENSTSNAVEDPASNVCQVKIHHETHGNNSLVETSGRHDTSGGDRGGHDTSGGDRGGHDTSGGDRGGHDISGGHTGGHDTSGGDCGGNDFSGGGGGGCDFASD